MEDTAASTTDVMEALRTVYDGCCAERKISIVDMGLVDRVRIDQDVVVVELVLTTGWCPFSIGMLRQAHDKVTELPGVHHVDVKINWQRPWDASRAAPWLVGSFRLLPEPGNPGSREHVLAAARRQTTPEDLTAATPHDNMEVGRHDR
ncbi:hypothetical protein IFM12275_24290 [Nocardia sputorum]|uniref:metal-sulfur cluster assembly factor n=1 Tax=Nocardia sputorum TaxID=2984338 RepID=UPI0024927E39|nr:iron-sulfur cluster assembly protein [Nocardia sputorum]BDT92453.1 hypothetical protein IFM12275_24290 [Nocardia sputorum]